MKQLYTAPQTQFFCFKSDLFWWCCGVEIGLSLAKLGFWTLSCFHACPALPPDQVDQVSITEKLQNIFTWLWFFIFTVFWSRNWQKCFMVKQNRQLVYMKTTCEKTCENKFLVFPASTAVSICHLKLNNCCLTIFLFFTKTDQFGKPTLFFEVGWKTKSWLKYNNVRYVGRSQTLIYVSYR